MLAFCSIIYCSDYTIRNMNNIHLVCYLYLAFSFFRSNLLFRIVTQFVYVWLKNTLKMTQFMLKIYSCVQKCIFFDAASLFV